MKFKWTKIIEIARIIASLLAVDEINAAAEKDNVQHDFRNEPDPFILNYWKGSLNLSIKPYLPGVFRKLSEGALFAQ